MEELRVIYATDAILENHGLADNLLQRIEAIVEDYSKRFNSDGLKVGIGVAAGVAGGFAGAGAIGGALGVGIHKGFLLTMGLIKASEVMDSVISDSKSAINAVHAFGMSSRDLMSNKLAREFGDETGKSLITALSDQGFIQSQEIDFASCGKFSNVRLEEKLVGYEKSLVSSCNYIGKLMRSNFYEEVARFRGHLESLFTGSIISTWKNDVISPVAGTLGSMAGNFAYNKINEAFKEREKLSASSRGYQEESKEGFNREKNKEKSKEESKRQKLDPEDLINKGRAAGGDKARANADSKGAGRGNSEGSSKKYTVKSGDTVSEIAQKFGVSTDELIKANPTLANNRKTDAYCRDIIIIKPGDKVVIPEKATRAGSTSGGNAGGSKPDHGYGPEYRKPDAEKSGPLNDNKKQESEQKQPEAGSANDEFWWCDSGGSGLCVASTEDAKRAEESLRESARKIGSIIIAGESLAVEQLEKLFDKLEQINPKFASHLKENTAIIADYINAASEYAASKIPDSIKSAYEAFLAGTTLEERKFLEYATAGAAAKGFKAFSKASVPNKGHKDFEGEWKSADTAGHKDVGDKVKFHDNEAQIKHIFRKNDEGHVIDTPENRKIILDSVNDAKNYLQNDNWGNKWYSEMLKDGRQVWAKVRDGKIIDAGINEKPIDIVKEYQHLFKNN